MLSKETKWYFCLQRRKFNSLKNTKLGYHGNNSSLILTRELILTSQNGNNLWNQEWPCTQKKSRIKLEINFFFFWCSYIFIYKHTEYVSAVFYVQPCYWWEWDQAVHTNFLERNYGLIELNGKTSVDFKQSRISALVFGGKGLFFFSS